MTERVTGHPGRYDYVSIGALEETEAAAVVVMVIGGKKGDGFSVSCAPEASEKVRAALPEMLRIVADAIAGSAPDGARVTTRGGSPGN
jgi:hypothetical protein